MLDGPRCVHCRGPLITEKLEFWQELNRQHPVPGVFATLFGIERAYGRHLDVLVCIECFCFQPYGTEHPPTGH